MIACRRATWMRNGIPAESRAHGLYRPVPARLFGRAERGLPALPYRREPRWRDIAVRAAEQIDRFYDHFGLGVRIEPVGE